MPNHISHKLTVRPKNEEKDWEKAHATFEEMEKFMKTDVSDFDFNKLIPMPPHSETFFAEGGLGQEEEKKYGKSNWYTWSIENWDTKWNAYSVAWDFDTLYFQTAWSTPAPVLIELSKKFPDTEIKVEYADEDFGSNCGIVIYKNGEIISERTNKSEPEYPWVVLAEKLYYEVSYQHEYIENKKLREKLKKMEEK
jgi:hypothetical protein